MKSERRYTNVEVREIADIHHSWKRLDERSFRLLLHDTGMTYSSANFAATNIVTLRRVKAGIDKYPEFFEEEMVEKVNELIDQYRAKRKARN